MQFPSNLRLKINFSSGIYRESVDANFAPNRRPMDAGSGEKIRITSFYCEGKKITRIEGIASELQTLS